MSQEEIRHTLEQLHTDLLRLGPLDADAEQKVNALAEYIRELIDSPEAAQEGNSFEELLEETMLSLEASHPKAAQLISGILSALNSAGI